MVRWERVDPEGAAVSRSPEPPPSRDPGNDRTKLIAHDMNNPLTAIRLLAETLRDEVADPQQRQDVLDILEAADLAGTFVEGMGSMVRNTSADEFTWFPIDLVEILRATVDRPALRRHVRLSVPAELQLGGDRTALKRAFTDILVNARRLVDRQSPVDVIGTEHASAIEVVVRHPGGGLPAELRPLLFEPFGPVELRRKRFPVIASGLYYARQVIEHHDGVVEFRNGGGTLDLVIRFRR
jgi:signal transduction histidine kinase